MPSSEYFLHNGNNLYNWQQRTIQAISSHKKLKSVYFSYKSNSVAVLVLV
jgi:hypothetical protein